MRHLSTHGALISLGVLLHFKYRYKHFLPSVNTPLFVHKITMNTIELDLL